MGPAGASAETKQRTERVADAAAMSGECLPERSSAARRILDGKEDWPGSIGEIESVRPTRQIGTTPRREQSAADGKGDEHLGAGLREGNHEARAQMVAAAASRAVRACRDGRGVSSGTVGRVLSRKKCAPSWRQDLSRLRGMRKVRFAAAVAAGGVGVHWAVMT